MTNQLWWYCARAGGIVAWAMLAASVLWGLALSTKALGPKPRTNWMLDLHRFLGGAAVVFTGVHVVSIIGDSFVHFGFAEVLVPFVGTWHPVAVAWGIVSMYLLLAVQITSMLRKRLSKRAWRITHFLSFPLFAMATIHGLTAGTDGSSLPVRLGALAVTSTVLGLTGLRIWQADRDRNAPAAPPRVPVRRPTATAVPAPADSELVSVGAYRPTYAPTRPPTVPAPPARNR